MPLLNRNIGCIEINFLTPNYKDSNKLNRNIGCIEIQFAMPRKDLQTIVEP